MVVVFFLKIGVVYLILVEGYFNFLVFCFYWFIYKNWIEVISLFRKYFIINGCLI